MTQTERKTHALLTADLTSFQFSFTQFPSAPLRKINANVRCFTILRHSFLTLSLLPHNKPVTEQGQGLLYPTVRRGGEFGKNGPRARGQKGAEPDGGRGSEDHALPVAPHSVPWSFSYSLSPLSAHPSGLIGSKHSFRNFLTCSLVSRVSTQRCACWQSLCLHGERN